MLFHSRSSTKVSFGHSRWSLLTVFEGYTLNSFMFHSLESVMGCREILHNFLLAAGQPSFVRVNLGSPAFGGFGVMSKHRLCKVLIETTSSLEVERASEDYRRIQHLGCSSGFS